MSVVLNGFDMPKSCRDCFIGVEECWGAYKCEFVKKWGDDRTRAEDCPLSELPEKNRTITTRIKLSENTCLERTECIAEIRQ